MNDVAVRDLSCDILKLDQKRKTDVNNSQDMTFVNLLPKNFGLGLVLVFVGMVTWLVYAQRQPDGRLQHLNAVAAQSAIPEQPAGDQVDAGVIDFPWGGSREATRVSVRLGRKVEDETMRELFPALRSKYSGFVRSIHEIVVRIETNGTIDLEYVIPIGVNKLNNASYSGSIFLINGIVSDGAIHIIAILGSDLMIMRLRPYMYDESVIEMTRILAAQLWSEGATAVQIDPTKF